MNEETLQAYVPYFKAIVALVAIGYFGYIFINRKKFKVANVAALSAVMAGLVTVMTMIVRVPIPASQGYLNFGDIMIMLTAVLFGPLIGGFAGGVGSALADLLGYPSWALFTLIIKGSEGIVVGYLAKGDASYARILVATTLGGAVMVIGYVSVAYLLYGPAGAVAEFYNDIVQAVSGIIIGGGLGYVLKKRLGNMI
ncbi:ECF transporter S component [Pyrococcus kukulkanii]|uniref:ECF transporter S component n=1 Tax=Pyrococcus kukulkanii TaxID=1609559 RepID=A0A127BAJ6_9EURY|nr:ECF transporter S component [Pyrococcus kukulkanii]AMM54352.1 membrane protein [Pyrococcus kukulkanii]